MNLLNILFGVASFVSLLYALWPNLFGTANGSSLNSWLFFGLCVVLTVSIYIYSHRSEQISNNGTQSGVVKISDVVVGHHEVFYQKKYVSPPNLTIDLDIGLGARLELIEQRADGFVFAATNISWSDSKGAYVKWQAHGEIATYNNILH